jgi:hypothetical protein
MSDQNQAFLNAQEVSLVECIQDKGLVQENKLQIRIKALKVVMVDHAQFRQHLS